MKKTILTLAAVLAMLPSALNLYGQCAGNLEKCAKANPGSMAGFTLVDAAYDELDASGGKLKVTLYAGNTYRFLSCPEDNMKLVMALGDSKGNLIATNLTEDKEGVYKMMEVNCTATAEYTLMLIPFGGKGCAGVIYAMK